MYNINELLEGYPESFGLVIILNVFLIIKNDVELRINRFRFSFVVESIIISSIVLHVVSSSQVQHLCRLIYLVSATESILS